MRSSYLYRRFNHKILYISLICLNDRAILVRLNYFPSSCVHGRHMTIKIPGVTGTFLSLLFIFKYMEKHIQKYRFIKHSSIFFNNNTKEKRFSARKPCRWSFAQGSQLFAYFIIHNYALLVTVSPGSMLIYNAVNRNVSITKQLEPKM